MSDLAEVLSNEPAAEVQPAVEPEAAPEPEQVAQEEATTAHETVEDAGEEKDEPKQGHQVPYAALKDERTKRQQLERELAEMRGKVDGLTHHKPEQAAEEGSSEDDFFADPTGYTSKTIDSRLQQVQQQYDQRLFAMSETWVRSQHEDYDDAVGAFIDAAKANPALTAQMQQSPMPAQFAYETGKTYLEVEQYGGSVESMRSKLREEILAELKQEQSQAAAKQPKSLAGARGVGGQFVPQEDDSLASILGG